MSPRQKEVEDEEKGPNVELRISHLERALGAWWRPLIGQGLLMAVLGGSGAAVYSRVAPRPERQDDRVTQIQEVLKPIDERLGKLELQSDTRQDSINKIREDLAAIRQAVQDLRSQYMERTTFAPPQHSEAPQGVAVSTVREKG